MGVKVEKNRKLVALVAGAVTVLVVAAVVILTVFFWNRGDEEAPDAPASGNLTTNETSQSNLFDTLHTTREPGAPQTVTCRNLAPGLATMPRGLDVTTLNFLPLNLADDLGYKHPVIDFTCNEEKTWRYGAETYDIPDQITAMSLVPGGWLSTQVQIYKDYTEVKTSMASSAGLEATFKKGMFSASASYKKMQHSITNSSKYIEKVSAFDSATRADLKPHWELDMGSSPKSYIEDILPENFEANVYEYNEFIEYYGTHFLKNARFGGTISLVIETSTTYYNGKTDSQVEAQARGSFLKILKANGGYSGSTTTVDRQFESQSSQIIKYYGGNTNLLSSSGMEAWQPTVAANPWLFSGDMVPISRLISDPTKRESMDRAVTNHINKALLREYERLLIFAGVKFAASFSNIQSLLSQVRSELAQPIPAQSVVDSLTNSIQNQILVPAWFNQRTQLCYRWYPDGDAGQCGGGASRTLCANPGSKTSYYRDDTDRRSGGCRMSWGITSSPGYDSWFSNVQICYRWYADGDGGQCGGGAPTEMCAKVGAYTQYYRDDTDRRGGGCRMSWRIKTPSDAPMWMKNVQLCYYWYPDGDGGQCGDGVDRTLCARAGSWTQYYRDDTDRRGGGCRMSWGLVLP